MPDLSLMPLSGMNTVSEDADLQRGGDSPRHYLRDALNMDLTPAGKAAMRQGILKVTDQPIKNLWQSPLHGDTFATIGDQWVRIDIATWSGEPLASVGEGEVSHEVVNNRVVVAAPYGLFAFDGSGAERLTLSTPPSPLVIAGEGSLPAGKYGAAVAFLRDQQESALSEMASVTVAESGSLAITFPAILDPSVTGLRLYLTEPNGGELRRQHDYSAGTPTVTVSVPEKLGAAAQFRHLSPMPTGQHLSYWRGRLITARANALRFSEALTYHLHDERHGFVLMPQRITFVNPVPGGIWVGQTDHVAFLRGASLDELSLERKASRPPVPGSAIAVDADTLSGELAGGGGSAALWLAENGYVVGTGDGQLVELHKGVMSGVTAQHGTSVVLDRRLITAVT